MSALPRFPPSNKARAVLLKQETQWDGTDDPHLSSKHAIDVLNVLSVVMSRRTRVFSIPGLWRWRNRIDRGGTGRNLGGQSRKLLYKCEKRENGWEKQVDDDTTFAGCLVDLWTCLSFFEWRDREAESEPFLGTSQDNEQDDSVQLQSVQGLGAAAKIDDVMRTRPLPAVTPDSLCLGFRGLQTESISLGTLLLRLARRLPVMSPFGVCFT